MPRRFRSGAKKIDFKQWGAIPGATFNITGDSTVGAGGLSFVEPATILRCRGTLLAQLDETKQVGDDIVLGFGLFILSSDAFASGTGAFPDPLGDMEFPWLYYHRWAMRASVAAGEESLGASCYRLEIDTKAMRKIKPLETLAYALQYAQSVGTPVCDVDIESIRVLIGT